jgi:hypothetical protein
MAKPKTHLRCYRYDKTKVKDVLCLHCKLKIGSEKYIEISGLARFGIMMFAHKTCDGQK